MLKLKIFIFILFNYYFVSAQFNFVVDTMYLKDSRSEDLPDCNLFVLLSPINCSISTSENRYISELDLIKRVILSSPAFREINECYSTSILNLSTEEQLNILEIPTMSVAVAEKLTKQLRKKLPSVELDIDRERKSRKSKRVEPRDEEFRYYLFRFNKSVIVVTSIPGNYQHAFYWPWEIRSLYAPSFD
jgi:hypothetical protein